MKSLVIDNFLPYPNVVRQWALCQNFYTAEEFTKRYGVYTGWPGVRTDHVMELDSAYANSVLGAVSDIVRQNYQDRPLSIKSYFQICKETDGDSWVHQDNDVDVAALIYLTPDAPTTSGTTLYRCNDLAAWQKLNIDDMMKINRIEKKSLYETLFTPIDSFGNLFNRLIVYPGTVFHKSNDYFGKTNHDGRLTQVIFIKFEQ